MVLKTESHPTNSRSAKMNPRDLKIKQIVETTRCTWSEAEEALQENNNELEAAVAWILDTTGDNVWTETKGRKVKKNEPIVEEKPERPPRGESGNRRGGKRGGGASRGAPNKVDWKPGQVFTRTESSVAAKTPSTGAATATTINATAPTPATTNASTTASTNNGVTTAPTSSNTAASASVQKPTPVIKTAAGPMSFAAVCAAGNKKPTPPPQAAPAPSSSTAAPKPSTPASTPVKPVQSPQVAAPSSATKESSPAPKETPVKEMPSVSKPEPVPQIPETSSHRFNDVQSLTSQLKNDLGLGSVQKPPTSTLISSSPSARGTVEFLSDLNTNKSFDYHFGFNPESSGVVEESSFKSSSGGVPVQNDFSRSHENDVYKTSNVDSSANKPLPSAVSQMSNSYSIPSQPPAQQQQQQNQRRTFGFAETSTVSYPPPENNKPSVNSTPVAPVTTTSTLSNYTKPAVTSQSSYSHSQPQVQQPHHQQSQQQIYNPMYNYPSYIGMYSPVATGRAEETAFATPYHIPYGYGMENAAMMPYMQAAAIHQHQQASSHRGEHHQTFNDMKQNYGQNASSNQNSSTGNSSTQRDANITSSNVVPPPPGFSGLSGPPAANHMFNQHALQSMFPYPAAMFMQKMPGQIYGQNVDDSMDARHQKQANMYGQQDKYSNGSNVRDRMPMGNPQPTPPTQGSFGQQGNPYGANGPMNLNSKKPYSGQWNN